MSSDLSWTSHYIEICKKAYTMLNLLSRTFSTRSVKARQLMYTSFVLSRQTYCSQVWWPHLLKDIQLLEQVQRRVTKFVLSDYSHNYKDLLKTLDLLPQ